MTAETINKPKASNPRLKDVTGAADPMVAMSHAVLVLANTADAGACAEFWGIAYLAEAAEGAMRKAIADQCAWAADNAIGLLEQTVALARIVIAHHQREGDDGAADMLGTALVHLRQAADEFGKVDARIRLGAAYA